MFQRLSDTATRWMNSRWMVPAVGVVSFLESIILPIPLEAILIPLMQKARNRLWLLAGVALLGCVAGAAVGYFVGYGLMESVGRPFVERTGNEQTLDQAQELMDEHGFWFIMAVSVMPIPFQIAMLAAGGAKYPFGLYMLATLISRGLRYFGLAFLVWWLGDRAEAFIKKHKVLAVVLLVLLLGGAWLAKSLLSGG